MKVVFVASEVAPYAKTGGLADVLGSLPQEIKHLGHEVFIFLPRYKCVDIQSKKVKIAVSALPVSIGQEKEKGKIYETYDATGARVFFVDCPEYFCRDGLYGTIMGDYPDNDFRFTFFQKGVLEALRALKIEPDIIHCHDWQVGLIPAYLKTLYQKDPIFKNTKTVFTIHNLAYQGNFPPDSLPATGLSWDEFKMERLEFYGKVSFMKAGMVYSDAVTTVSENYSHEIQNKDFGCGFEGVLSTRKKHLYGIVNGIDYQEWNPETDPDIPQTFSAGEMQGKAANKAALQKENRFQIDESIPVIGLISRLVDQKGVDILTAALDEMIALGSQFVLLGTGDDKYHQLFRQIGKQYREYVGIHIVFDPVMAKRIYAGCDFMAIPSYYEPCGLAQMIALRYGTIPIVRAVGGLADTVCEYNPKTKKGNGFRFEDYTSRALISCVKRALRVFKNRPQWEQLLQNAMVSDFSWRASAEKYIDLYQKVEKVSLEQEI